MYILTHRYLPFNYLWTFENCFVSYSNVHIQVYYQEATIIVCFQQNTPRKAANSDTQVKGFGILYQT